MHYDMVYFVFSLQSFKTIVLNHMQLGPESWRAYMCAVSCGGQLQELNVGLRQASHGLSTETTNEVIKSVIESCFNNHASHCF